MKEQNIVFVGCGNMAKSLIVGLLADGVSEQKIWVTDVDAEKITAFTKGFGVNEVRDLAVDLAQADIVVLAVKPQNIKEVAGQLKPYFTAPRPLVMSIAAGIRASDITRWLGGERAVVRAMPNTPALVRSGATALFANEYASNDQRDMAESIMRAVGITCWVDDEASLNVVTALSGSGPAYFFLVIEMLEKSAVELGLTAETSRLLALQTAMGAAKLALESDEDVADLRQRVTSPGGTTEQALKVLLEGNVEQLFQQAVTAASQRSEELAEEFGAD